MATIPPAPLNDGLQQGDIKSRITTLSWVQWFTQIPEHFTQQVTQIIQQITQIIQTLTISGTGVVKVNSGTINNAASLITNSDVDASAGIVESKLSLNYPTHPQLHHTSHNTGGTDAIAPGDIGAVVANAPITGATKTKITYDAKGLVDSGADATTADIAASTDKNYVTDAQLDLIRSGRIGIPGQDGEAGEDGVTIVGPTGPAGATGSNGTNGTNGIDGKTIPGQDGAEGEPGALVIGVNSRFSNLPDTEILQSGILSVNANSSTTAILTYAKFHGYATASVADTSVIIQDSFTAADNTPMAGRTPDVVNNGNTWQDPSNKVQILSNVAARTADYATFNTNINTGATSYTLEADIYCGSNYAILSFRNANDGSANWAFWLYNGGGRLDYNNTYFSPLTISPAPTSGNTYHVEIDVTPSNFQIYVAGNLVIDALVTLGAYWAVQNYTQTYVGVNFLGVGTETVDNFTVSSATTTTVVTSPSVILTPVRYSGGTKVEAHVDAITSTNCTVHLTNLDSTTAKCVLTALVIG